jgi:predicted DNA-binding protein (MmcQ/YjbR family)
VNVKCDSNLALELRARYAAVRTGYHMNKRHLNTVDLDGSVDSDELLGMIEDSYQLVLATLPKKECARIIGSGGHDRAW